MVEMKLKTAFKFLPAALSALLFSCGTVEKGLIVPLYTANQTAWQKVANATVPEIVVLNPSNGPGSEYSQTYGDYINLLNKKGKTPVGYIYTKWGSRPLAEVEADIDRWLEFYPDIKGFFIDEVEPTSDQLEYYRELVDYIRGISPSLTIVLNAGRVPENTEFFNLADRVVVYEGDFLHKPQKICDVNPDKSSIIVYNASEAVMKAILYTEDCADYYVTDDAPPNPYDRLPIYFDEEVSTLSQINLAIEKYNEIKSK